MSGSLCTSKGILLKEVVESINFTINIWPALTDGTSGRPGTSMHIPLRRAIMRHGDAVRSLPRVHVRSAALQR
jgi:hypothetical protein